MSKTVPDWTELRVQWKLARLFWHGESRRQLFYIWVEVLQLMTSAILPSVRAPMVYNRYVNVSCYWYIEIIMIPWSPCEIKLLDVLSILGKGILSHVWGALGETWCNLALWLQNWLGRRTKKLYIFPFTSLMILLGGEDFTNLDSIGSGKT